MPEDEAEKLSPYAEAVLNARLLLKDYREDLTTAIAKAGKLLPSTAGRKEYFDAKEKQALSELQVKGLLSKREPTERAWEILDRVSLVKVARQLRADLRESNDARAVADTRTLRLTQELTSLEPLRALTELLGGSLRRLDLDGNWATATVALIAQELAIAAKLKELNPSFRDKKKVPPSEEEEYVHKDFPDLTLELREALKNTGKPIPEVMIAIADDYRNKRNKLCHQGGKVDTKALNLAKVATDELVRSLFPG